jgi:hypothetical protein
MKTLSKTIEDRKSILRFLQWAKFNVPDHGKAKDLYFKHSGYGLDCVVYFDNIGPQKMSLVDANKKWPENFAVLYLGISGIPAPSALVTKMIQIGDRSFWFDFKSQTDWRSNQGKWKSKLQMVCPGYHKIVKLPLFSVDFIKKDITYAIDFDLIPAGGKTTLHKVISRKEIANLIKKANKELDSEY